MALWPPAWAYEDRAGTEETQKKTAGYASNGKRSDALTPRNGAVEGEPVEVVEEVEGHGWHGRRAPLTWKK
jgi:hypothetical protein